MILAGKDDDEVVAPALSNAECSEGGSGEGEDKTVDGSLGFKPIRFVAWLEDVVLGGGGFGILEWNRPSCWESGCLIGVTVCSESEGLGKSCEDWLYFVSDIAPHANGIDKYKLGAIPIVSHGLIHTSLQAATNLPKHVHIDTKG